jgi:hypothetical protein
MPDYHAVSGEPDKGQPGRATRREGRAGGPERSPIAEANEAQGLKIAVSAFIMISVILAVACYFLYAAYSEADARRVAPEAKARPPAAAPSNSPR